MQKIILDYLREHSGPIESEDDIITWWKGLQGLTDSLDDLTEALEVLEDSEAIEKVIAEKELFIYRIKEGE